jgi:hypothetical protein
MNAILHHKIQNLTPAKLEELKHTLSGSPVTLRFILFLEQYKNKKFSTSEAVCFVYGINKNAIDYKAYENKFYKLRKKLHDHLTDTIANQSTKFPDEQQWLSDAQILLSAGKFKEAQKLLLKTEKLCWKNNIFEILPDVIDTLIQTNQAINTIGNNKNLHIGYPRVLQLHTDLLEAKNVSRQIYEVNLLHGIKATEPLFNRLAKLVVKHRDFARFKLIYNFVSAYYKTGAGGDEYENKTHVINRHIAAAQKILKLQPDIPALHYLFGYRTNQIYRINEIQALLYYKALRYREAAIEIFKLYELVMSDDSAFARMKTEVFFTNTIHILVSAERFDEALQVAATFEAFIKQNKNYERMLLVYYELANIHAAMYPRKTKYDTNFLIKQLDEYNIQNFSTNEPNHAVAGLILKTKLLASDHRFAEAQKIIGRKGLSSYFSSANCIELTIDIFKAVMNKERSDITTKLKAAIKHEKLNATVPGDYNWFLFLEKLVNNLLTG